MTEPSLDLIEVAARILRPDESARTHARELVDALPLPPGGVAPLADLAVWLAGARGVSPPGLPQRPRLVVFAGDHGPAGVSVTGPSTPARVRALLDDTAPTSALARRAGVTLRVVDVSVDDPEPLDASLRVRQGAGPIDVADAVSREEAEAALLVGMRVVDEEVDAGADLLLLGDVGAGSTSAAAALIGLLTRADAASVTGRGGGVDDAGWMRKCAVIRDAMRRGRPHLGDQVGLLATVGGADLAAMTGFLLQAAARRTPVVLDGVVTTAAALVAQRAAFRSVGWWLAPHRSAEPAHAAALDRLSLVPLLDLTLDAGEGLGALLAVPLLESAAALLDPPPTS